MSVIYLPSELKESRAPSFSSLQRDFTPLKPGKPGGWLSMQGFGQLPGRTSLSPFVVPQAALFTTNTPHTSHTPHSFIYTRQTLIRAAVKQLVISSVCHVNTCWASGNNHFRIYIQLHNWRREVKYTAFINKHQ